MRYDMHTSFYRFQRHVVAGEKGEAVAVGVVQNNVRESYSGYEAQ